jgi:hypothetical protein
LYIPGPCTGFVRRVSLFVDESSLCIDMLAAACKFDTIDCLTRLLGGIDSHSVSGRFWKFLEVSLWDKFRGLFCGIDSRSF